MNIEREVNTNEKEKVFLIGSNKKDLSLIAGVLLVFSAMVVGMEECLPTVPSCEEKKTPQEVRDYRDHDQPFPPDYGQHM